MPSSWPKGFWRAIDDRALMWPRTHPVSTNTESPFSTFLTQALKGQAYISHIFRRRAQWSSSGRLGVRTIPLPGTRSNCLEFGD
jgi:hypothetical protein